MDQIAITFNPENGKIITVPIGQTIDSSLTQGYETVAVVPRNKVDFAIGFFIGIYFRTKDIDFIKQALDTAISKYDEKIIIHIKNTDI